jgi:DNA transformation protein
MKRSGAGARRTSARRDDSFLEFVLDQMSAIEGLESRAMFGGHGIYGDGIFFAIVFGGRLYFRTSEDTVAEYLRRRMRPFRPSPRQTLGTYYEVPPEVIEDPAQVARWARAAIAAAGQAATIGRSRRRPRARRDV